MTDFFNEMAQTYEMSQEDLDKIDKIFKAEDIWDNTKGVPVEYSRFNDDSLLDMNLRDFIDYAQTIKEDFCDQLKHAVLGNEFDLADNFLTKTKNIELVLDVIDEVLKLKKFDDLEK